MFTYFEKIEKLTLKLSPDFDFLREHLKKFVKIHTEVLVQLSQDPSFELKGSVFLKKRDAIFNMMLFQIKKKEINLNKKPLAEWLAQHDCHFRDDVNQFIESGRAKLSQLSKARTIAQAYQQP